MLVPLISLICHSFLPKIEIRLKYILDKKFPKTAIVGEVWRFLLEPASVAKESNSAARDQSFAASKAALAEMKEKALVSTMTKSVQNRPKNSKEIHKSLKHLKYIPNSS